MCLNDAADWCLAAARADFTFTVVYSMVILIAPVLIERISIGAVVECGAFEADSFVEHVLDGIVEFGDAGG